MTEFRYKLIRRQSPSLFYTLVLPTLILAGAVVILCWWLA